MAAARARVDGTVRVAAIYSVGLHDVSRPMQQFQSLYPEARVQLECLHPHKVVEAVLDGEADFGIMSYPPRDAGPHGAAAPRGADGARLPPRPPAGPAGGRRRPPT